MFLIFKRIENIENYCVSDVSGLSHEFPALLVGIEWGYNTMNPH
jgi:hypothetical protein